MKEEYFWKRSGSSVSLLLNSFSQCSAKTLLFSRLDGEYLHGKAISWWPSLRTAEDSMISNALLSSRDISVLLSSNESLNSIFHIAKSLEM